MWGIQHYVIKLFRDLRQVFSGYSCFLCHNITKILLKVVLKHHKPTLIGQLHNVMSLRIREWILLFIVDWCQEQRQRKSNKQINIVNYVIPTPVGWRIAILRFFFTIIIIIIIIILPHIFVRSISQRCLDQTLWNLGGISYAMWSCAFKGWFFKMAAIAMETTKMLKKQENLGFLSSNFMKLCRNIHGSEWQLLESWKKFKMAAVAMVTKVQKMLNSLQASQIFVVMFPVTSTSSGTR